jgi:hypothetical protein
VHPACVAMWALRGLPIIGVPFVLEWSGYRETLLSHVQRVASSSDMRIVTQTFSGIVKHAVAFAGAVGSDPNMLMGNQSYRIAQSILDEASSGLATLEMLQTDVSTASSTEPCDHWSAAREGIAVLHLQFKDILRPELLISQQAALQELLLHLPTTSWLRRIALPTQMDTWI